MKTKFSKTLSIILAMLMLVSGLEVTGFASNVTNNSEISFDDIEIEREKPNIENEIISKRTAYSKVFSTDDGGYYSVVSATPIHIKDANGNYQNIEEPLVELTSEEVIADYIASESELFEASSNHTINSRSTDVNQLAESDFIIKCFSASGTSVPGYYVQVDATDESIVCIKPNIVPNNILVTSAKIYANALGLGNTTNNLIAAKKITKSWNENSTRIPSFSKKPFDCATVLNAAVTTSVEWDFTHLMNSWLLGLEPNNGIALTPDMDNCNVSLSTIRISYYYREIDELDENLTYESIDVGSVGTVYINHFSCIPVFKYNNPGIDGEKAPVFISHIYNPLSQNLTDDYGNFFRINYVSTLNCTSSLTYTWHTIEGNTIDFVYSNETADTKSFVSVGVDPTYSLTIHKNNSSNSFEPTTFENINIENNDTQQKYTFVSNSGIGYLHSVSDGTTSDNAITITYEHIAADSSNTTAQSLAIKSITDGVGRKYDFNYVLIENTTYLQSIDVKNAAGQQISYLDNNISFDFKIEYEYNIVNGIPYLLGVDFIGDEYDITYSYDSCNRLETISSGNNVLTLSYVYNPLTDDSNTQDTSNSQDISHKLSSYSIVDTFWNTSETVLIDNSNVYKRVFTKQINNIDNNRIIKYDENYNIVYYEDFDGTVLCGFPHDDETIFVNNSIISNNLITNSDFSSYNGDEEFDDWIPENYRTDFTLFDGGEKYHNMLQLTGHLLKTTNVYQQVTLAGGANFEAGTSYVYGGIAKGNNALVSNGNRKFGIYIFNATLQNNELIPNECVSYFNFDHTLNSDYQQKVSCFTLEEDTPALFVYLCFDYNYTGANAYFDNIHLYEYEIESETPSLPAPYIYEYDNPNHSLTAVKKISKSNENKYMGLTYEYDRNCNLNYLSSINDERGITTYYTYDPDTGRLISVADGVYANARNFQYTATGLLSSVQQTVTNTITGNIVEMKTDYGYSNGMISSVSHNGFSYNFAYDNYGNITSINVCEDETPLVSTSYSNVRNGQIGKISYANGGYIKYTYGTDNSISQIEYGYNTDNNEEICYKSISYSFDNNTELYSITDNHAKTKILYDDSTFRYCLDDNNDGVYEVIYSAINNNGETVEEFNQFESATKIITTPSVTTTNDLLETTSSSSQTLTKEIPMRNDNGNIMTDNSGKIQTYISETYTYNRTSVYDEFMRPTSNAILAHYEIESENTFINSEERYTYRSNNDGKETTLIDSYRTIKSTGNNDNSSNDNNPVSYDAFIDLTYSYEYDPAGNISKIDLKDNITNTESVYSIFKYDNANQLIFEYSASKNSCISYAYDAGGNITEKRVYDLSAYDMTNGTISSGAAYERYVYTYDDTYKDRLISVSNGESSNTTLIDYDDLGNPLNYEPADGVFTWNGHLLTSFENNGEGKRYEYEYDANEVRTRKIVYDKDLISGTSEYTYTKTGVLDYVWADGVLKGVSITNFEQHTNFFINIIYDESGNAQGYVGVTGTPYYFVRDPLGNITSIIAATDEVNIEVKYDAWGNPTFPQYNDDPLLGVVAAFVCSFNPSTYKGYIYDIETGLYCCGSRYYSSEWSRFINIDDGMLLNLAKGKTMATNLYTYCNNNPVNITADGAYLNTHWYLNNPSTFNTLDFDIAKTSTVEFLFACRIKNDYLK